MNTCLVISARPTLFFLFPPSFAKLYHGGQWFGGDVSLKRVCKRAPLKLGNYHMERCAHTYAYRIPDTFETMKYFFPPITRLNNSEIFSNERCERKGGKTRLTYFFRFLWWIRRIRKKKKKEKKLLAQFLCALSLFCFCFFFFWKGGRGILSFRLI